VKEIKKAPIWKGARGRGCGSREKVGDIEKREEVQKGI